MARSSTTGVYTRVDNSFSNPVLGTVISPTDADSFFDDIDGAMNSYIATSTTSLAIGVGSKTFTVASAIATKVFLANTQIHAFSLSNTANFMDCTVVSYSTSTGALVTTCFAVGGSGTITDWVIVSAGARGGAGPIAGFRQTYDSDTADSDPGAGDFKLNHATPASATAVYFDNTDTGGNTITTILDALDDHGNSSGRGILRAEKENDSSVWAQWLLSGSIVDGTGYRKGTLSGGSGSGSFTATDAFRWAFYPKGADGTIGGTTGATDNAILAADGAGGGTAQARSGTISDAGKLTLNIASAVTNTVEQGAKVSHTTSDTPAAGIGVGMEFEVETAAGNNEVGATIEAITTDVTSTSEDFDLVLKTMKAGAAASESLRVGDYIKSTYAAYFPEATLTDGANIAWNLQTQQTAKVTLGGNRTLDAPTNLKAGATYVLRVIQDGTGSRTLSWNAAYKFPGGTDPTLSTGASAVDVVTFVSDGTSLFGVCSKAFA
jgi:hypothetical protein